MTSSSSSSSTSKKKATKFSQIQPTRFKKAYTSKASSLTKRRETVFKKAYELSILCGIEVCVICYGSDGKLSTWPEDKEKVTTMARRYSELSDMKRRKGSVDLREFLKKINTEDSKNKKKKRKVRVGSNQKYPDWDPRFDTYSVEQLAELIQALESKQFRLQHRFRAVVEAQKDRKMQNTNYVPVQEQRMMTNVSTMNHQLQQHPNQVSMYLSNHGNGYFSQVPVSAPSFNQSQPLPPIPNSLTIYQNPNAENNSRLLGVQDNGLNGFQNMNMLTYNNSVDALSRQIYQNCKADDYSGSLGVQETGGSLGVQETGTNQFENPNMQDYNNFSAEDYLRLLGVQDTGLNGFQNMYGYNNNISNSNGVSNQCVQFPN